MKSGPYEMVIAPPEYPGKRYRNRYCYEHHLVWWKATGNLVRAGYDIHHVNENKRDNRISNLEELSHAEHTREHNIERSPDTVTITCFRCSKEFSLIPSVYRWRIGASPRLFCGRSCQVTQQQEDRRNVPR